MNTFFKRKHFSNALTTYFTLDKHYLSTVSCSSADNKRKNLADPWLSEFVLTGAWGTLGAVVYMYGISAVLKRQRKCSLYNVKGHHNDEMEKRSCLF
jgi:hypothetical protein